MAEELKISSSQNKASLYDELIPQLKALISDEPDATANLANVAAGLKEAFGFFWVGFYLVKAGELVLGPFQGPIACTRIQEGKGVCGSSWEQKKTIVVPDVDQFPGHIACSSASRSEIVVPLIKDDKVIGVLDVDSDQLDAFDETDQEKLELLVDIVANKI